MPRAIWFLVTTGALLLVLLLSALISLFWGRAAWQVHASVVLFTLLILVAVVFAPRARVRNLVGYGHPLEIAKVEEECRKTAAQLITALAVVAGIYLWAATDSGTREDRISNRLNLAIDQLARVDARGTKVLESRLAAIFSLASIAQQSSSDSSSIIKMLIAYIRRNSEEWGGEEWSRKCDERHRPVSRENHDDLRYALVAVTHLYGTARRTEELDLSEIVVRDSKLNGVDLKRVVLRRATLSEAGLLRARLDEAALTQTNFRDANLEEASLRNAILWAACLQAANLKRADLRGAQLWGAHLQGASFEEANADQATFEAARLEGANFKGANLRTVSFENASLKAVTFRAALLAGADFKGADVNEADFRGVDLSEVKNLSREQLGKARTDHETQLPR